MSSTDGLSSFDQDAFALALRLARRGLGNVAPNPAVGCVLTKDNTILARGWTQPGGRPHAEAHALLQAGDTAKGATAYVTLEPCSHYGKTPPCSDALIEAGIARVVVGPTDPDPRVSGSGLTKLKDAGIQVDSVQGDLMRAAEDVNQGFFLRVTENRPMVTLKLATTLDGRLAAHTGNSQWITGEEARNDVHRVRAEHDAILVGARTAILDNPSLTVRTGGMEEASPLRVVMDSHLRLPLTHKIVTTAQAHPTVIFASPAADPHRVKAFKDTGVDVELVTLSGSSVSPLHVVTALAERGITRLMIEGGGRLAASFLAAGLVDRVLWYRAPKIIGGDGVSALAALGLDTMAQAYTLDPLSRRALGQDIVEEYKVLTLS